MRIRNDEWNRRSVHGLACRTVFLLAGGIGFIALRPLIATWSDEPVSGVIVQSNMEYCGKTSLGWMTSLSLFGLETSTATVLVRPESIRRSAISEGCLWGRLCKWFTA